MKVALLTREFPPDVYGGAGVHVEYLARELERLEDLTVHAWGSDRDGVVGHGAWDALAGDAPHLAALRAMSIDLSMTAGAEVGVDHDRDRERGFTVSAGGVVVVGKGEVVEP